MKAKIILAAIICCLGFQTTNADIKKSTDNWTQKSNTPTLRDVGTEPPDADPSPVGDAVPYICLLAGAYLTFLVIRKQTSL